MFYSATPASDLKFLGYGGNVQLRVELQQLPFDEERCKQGINDEGI